MHKFQIGSLVVSALFALISPFAKQSADNIEGSAPEQPHYVAAAAPPNQQPAPPAPKKSFESGAGFSTYTDPLEARVVDLENRVNSVEQYQRTVSTQAQPAQPQTAPVQAASTGQVNSQVVAQNAPVNASGAVTVRSGASAAEVVDGLRALGYQTSYNSSGSNAVQNYAVSYAAPSYGSAGVSAVNYGSAGTSAVSYGSGGSSTASYAYSQPQVSYASYSAPMAQVSYAQPAMQYAAPVAAPVRTGLFGRRSASYGAYSAGATCRWVNGQLICN